MGKGSKSLFVKSANRNNNEKTKKKLLGFKEANDMAAAQKPQGGGIVNSSSSTKLQGTTKLTLCREDESTILKFLALLNHGESKLDNIIEDASSSDKDSDTDSDTDSDEYSDSGDSADVNRMVDDLCDNSKSEFNDRIFDSYENAPFANGMKSKERRKEAKEVESVPTEAFKRMLIRGDRFDSKAEVIADATHKQLTKVAIRNSVLTENNSKSFEDKINKSSNVESAKVIKQTAKRVGDKVRISVSCEKKSDTKVFVLSRSTTNEELLTQVRKKFNLTSASNMKKFNSFRVVLSLKKGLFEDFHDLSMLDDATHLQICHSHLGVSLPDQMEKQDIERTVEQDESVLVEKKDVPIELEVDEIEAEVVAGADALPAPPDAILNGVDAELPPPPPVYIRPLPSEEDILRSKAMKDSYNALVRTKEYQEILLHRCKLPIFEAKEQILTALKDNQVIVVCGETGSGKVSLDTNRKHFYSKENGIYCVLFCDI